MARDGGHSDDRSDPADKRLVLDFLTHLVKRRGEKISPGFDAKGRAPETPAKLRMMRAAEAPEKAQLRDWLEEREGPFAGDLFEVRHVSAALACT